MKSLRICLLGLAACALSLSLGLRTAAAKADVVELYANAVISADTEMLEKVLAPNYWHIAANGHIQDKEHFIESIKNKQLVINHLTLTNLRRSMIGDCTIMTGNGILRTLIRQYLQTVSGVSRFYDEHVQFGGAGITVVDLE